MVRHQLYICKIMSMKHCEHSKHWHSREPLKVLSVLQCFRCLNSLSWHNIAFSFVRASRHSNIPSSSFRQLTSHRISAREILLDKFFYYLIKRRGKSSFSVKCDIGLCKNLSDLSANTSTEINYMVEINRIRSIQVQISWKNPTNTSEHTRTSPYMCMKKSLFLIDKILSVLAWKNIAALQLITSRSDDACQLFQRNKVKQTTTLSQQRGEPHGKVVLYVQIVLRKSVDICMWMCAPWYTNYSVLVCSCLASGKSHK